MFIYIGGPYTTRPNRTTAENVKDADTAGRLVLKKGHIPFIPHTMMANWEEEGIEREEVRKVCHRWLERCDGFLYIGPSPGADEERQQAEQLGLEIFENIDKVPHNEGKEARLEHKVTAYLTEYQQCQESYRHTYQTIWQAGAILIAASFLIITFWDKSVGITPISVALASVPFLIWWWAIFRPMDWYGQIRRKRLEDLEVYLNRLIPGLKLEHFQRLRQEREQDRSTWEKIWHTITTPAVHWAVNVLGLAVLAVFVLAVLAIYRIGPYAP